MLFHEFFPRLRQRAETRYGVAVTERQFKDWRENGLLQGPAAPKGRGRGRSPVRHWPIASYRRALRLCRYKSWGAKRKSQWWLGLWFSGEGVLPSILQAALKREYSINRRRIRNVGQIGRSSSPSATSNSDPISDLLVSAFFPNEAMPREHLQQIYRLEFDHLSDDDPRNRKRIEIFHQTASLIFGPEASAAVRADIKPEDIKRIWRPGYLAEGENQAGDYLNHISSEKMQTCFALLRLRERLVILNYVFNSRIGNVTPENINGHALAIRASHANQLQFRIMRFIQIAFEVSADELDGIDAELRLRLTVEKYDGLTSVIKDMYR